MLKRGQISTEYMVIVAFALALVIPATLIYLKYSGEGGDQVLMSKMEGVAEDLSMAINTVYAYGEDTETSALIKLPKGVKRIRFSGKDITFTLTLSSHLDTDVAKVVSATMADCLIENPPPGTYKIGIKKVYHEASQGEVITFKINEKNC